MKNANLSNKINLYGNVKAKVLTVSIIWWPSCSNYSLQKALLSCQGAV